MSENGTMFVNGTAYWVNETTPFPNETAMIGIPVYDWKYQVMEPTIEIEEEGNKAEGDTTPPVGTTDKCEAKGLELPPAFADISVQGDEETTPPSCGAYEPADTPAEVETPGDATAEAGDASPDPTDPAVEPAEGRRQLHMKGEHFYHE